MADFEAATRVDRVGAGRYGATLSSDWEIWGPNGGYLAAIALRAAAAEAEIQRPVSLYCHYLRVARFEPVELLVEVLARGRRSESLRVSMRQAGKPVLEAMVRTARVVDGLCHRDVQAPAVPAPEVSPAPQELGEDYAGRHRFWGNFDVRVVQPERFSLPRTARAPHFIEWYRLECARGFSDPFVDAGRTALLLDTVGWPAAATAHAELTHIAPSLDVAVWFHASGADSEWVLAEAHSAFGDAGCITASGRLFDRRGQLLGTSGTQLLCTPIPTGA